MIDFHDEIHKSVTKTTVPVEEDYVHDLIVLERESEDKLRAVNF